MQSWGGENRRPRTGGTSSRANGRLGRLLGRGALVLFILGAALTVVLATPVAAEFLIERLQIFPPLTAEDLAKAASDRQTAIVVLSAGLRPYAPEFGGLGATVDALSLERVRYGAYLARQTGLPVLLSGGYPPGGAYTRFSLAALMADTLSRDYGVSARWLETRSQNTAENAIYSADILKQAGIRRVLLVTHAWHMDRAVRAFRANGMIVIPAPTAFRGGTPLRFPYSLIPDVSVLSISEYALHESIGIVWYRIRYGF